MGAGLVESARCRKHHFLPEAVFAKTFVRWSLTLRLSPAEFRLWGRRFTTTTANVGLRVGAEDQAERELVCVGVLKGSFVFMADLLRAIDLPLVVDFMALSSYAGTRSTGAVRILKDLERSIDGRDVLIIEDIIDTGLTMTYLLKSLEARKPASIRVCSLVGQEGSAASGRQRAGHPLRRFSLSGCVRGRLRPRLSWAISKPSLHRRSGSQNLLDSVLTSDQRAAHLCFFGIHRSSSTCSHYSACSR